jgi:predicted AlkP superfamily pyrophosphatase or phosphodiesterase
MVYPTAVIDVVGLSRSILGPQTPRLNRWFADQPSVALEPPLPAVTTPVQSSMVTGLSPRDHGIVGNGWYHRELSEIRFWHRSNRLVQGEKVWDTARRADSSVTCANLFWWYNTYSNCEVMAQVRPIYKADGRKIPDCYTEPAELREELQARFGSFPLFNFWGPMSDRRASDWIVNATMHVHAKHWPTLTLVYLPHMDYSLQKYGPGSEQAQHAAGELDEMLGRLIDYFQTQHVRVMLVSEYGIEPATGGIPINRHLREAGGVRVRQEDGRELLDPGASEAFAVADHQVAQVYVQNAQRIDHYARLCGELDGVAKVLTKTDQHLIGLDHARSGDLVLVAARGHWFLYDYWLDPAKAPDFAPTVDINRKPGYDPRELFIDPRLRWPKAKIAWRLLKKKLGFRTLMDVIALDPTLVKGTHGRLDMAADYQPLMLLPPGTQCDIDALPAEAVRDVMLRSLFDEQIIVGPADGPAQRHA